MMIFRKRKALQVTAVLVILGCAVYFLLMPRRGDIIETWETTNGTFKVRVTAYSEKNTFPALGGAYYVFQSAAVGSGEWSEIMTVRHDDPLEIPRDQVRLISDKIGYAFMLYDYAVTTDGGASWSVWNVSDLPDWRRTRANIKDVRLTPDGTGTMSLTSSADQKAPELHTINYGRHWTAE